jgi:O-antigen ligase
MEKIFEIEDSTANKISYYHLMLFLVSLPFDRFYSHLILISFFIHTLINFEKKNIKSIFTVSNFVLTSIFFVTLIGTFYSSQKSSAINELGKHSLIFLLPIFFCLNPINLGKYRDKLLYIFSIGCTLAVIYLYVQALLTLNYYHLPKAALLSTAFTNHNFSEPFALHATYFSMQLALALMFLIAAAIKTSSLKHKIFMICCCLVLIAGIIQLSSKSIVISIVVLGNIAVPYFLLKGKSRYRALLLSVPITLLLFASIYKIDALKTRFISALKNDLSSSTTDSGNDPRMVRWQIAVTVAKETPMIGHGSGTETELLRAYYFEKKLFRSYLASLNAHNEYLSLWIKVGIWGLLIYLLGLFFGFKLSIDRKDLLFFSFLLLITIISFSENILDVDKGILFFIFFW